MDKNSAEHIPCTFCSNDALPDTDPPVCEECKNTKRASEDSEPNTLKELQARD